MLLRRPHVVASRDASGDESGDEDSLMSTNGTDDDRRVIEREMASFDTTDGRTAASPDRRRRRAPPERLRFEWLVGQYAQGDDEGEWTVLERQLVPSDEALAAMCLEEIESELQSVHASRGTLAIVSRRARERLVVPSFAPSAALQRRALLALDRWAIAMQQREAALAAEWRRRCPLPHRQGCLAAAWSRFRAFCRRRPLPSVDALA
jgi:hypothetical protein